MDLVEERRENALNRTEAYRSRVVRAYNKRVRPRDFQVGELVLKKVNPAGEVSKLQARWEGPYKVISKVSTRALYLEDRQGKALKSRRTVRRNEKE